MDAGLGRDLMADAVSRIAGLLHLGAGRGFARGSAGLYALLAALARDRGPGEVVVPAICCESVALAAAYAGHAVRIAEISPETLCLTPETLAPHLSARTRAVLVVHVFGIDARCARFQPLRDAFPEAVFVEDIAHAVGGRDEAGRFLGGALDYALLSFADDKILPGNGGMLAPGPHSRGPALDALEGTVAADAPPTPPRPLALSLRNLVHGLADLWRERPQSETAPAFMAIAGAYRDLIVCGGPIRDLPALDRAAGRLEAIRSGRYARYLRYRNGIDSARARVIDLHGGSTCWRCPVLLQSPRQAREVTATLRAKGIHASNHYFPLNLLFGGGRLPVAEEAAARIVNLWVDEATPESMVDAAIDTINHC